MHIETRSITTNYEISGPETAPVVMLSHSLGSSLRMWDPQLATLEKKYRVVRYDTRGHGGSEVVDGAYSLEQLGEDAVNLMDALGLEKVHWVGLSLGGMIGQNLALQHRDRLLSAALCDTMAALPEGGNDMWSARITAAREQGMEPLTQATMERWFTPGYLAQDPGSVKAIREYFLTTAAAGFIGCCEAIRQLNYLEQLGQVDLPTVVIVGEQDFGTPVAASEAIHKQISGSQLVIIPDAAHLSNVEQADAFTGALLDFLASQTT